MSKIIRKELHNRVEYRLNDKLHRDDGPAIEYPDGTKFWCQEDNLHRLDGPAIEYADGEKHWYQNGKLHRLDGPAIEYADGTKSWYVDGQSYDQDEFLKMKEDSALKAEENLKLKKQALKDLLDGLESKNVVKTVKAFRALTGLSLEETKECLDPVMK